MKNIELEKYKAILLHLIQHTLQHLGELQRRLTELHDNKSITQEYKTEKVTELATESVRILATLEPALPLALQEFAEFKDFIESCIFTVNRMRESAKVTTNLCNCKGCNDHIK